MKNQQQGIGMIEVMVALIVLAIAVLGFSAMQIQAVNASIEATNNIHATHLARDLAERLRVNRQGLINLQRANFTASGNKDCGRSSCTEGEMASYDFKQVQQRATDLGMTVAVHNCQGINTRMARSCVYVAWGDTLASNGNTDKHCTQGTTYKPHAQCIIMEIYNR